MAIIAHDIVNVEDSGDDSEVINILDLTSISMVLHTWKGWVQMSTVLTQVITWEVSLIDTIYKQFKNTTPKETKEAI